MDVHERERSRTERGAGLASLLLVVVVLGALTASVIVGVSTMTGSGIGSGVLSAATSTTRPSVVKKTNTTTGTGSRGGAIVGNACKASAAAADSASSLYFANSGGRYPVKWSDLTASTPPLYQLATNVVINVANPMELDGNGWRLTMAGGGTTAPTFTCQ
jgi:hypothetical protein